MGWVKDFVVNTPFGDMINAAAAEKKAQKQKLDAVAMSLAQHSATQDINRQAAQKERADILAFKTDPVNIEREARANAMAEKLGFDYGKATEQEKSEFKTMLDNTAAFSKLKFQATPEYQGAVSTLFNADTKRLVGREIATDTAKFKNEIAQKTSPEYKKMLTDTIATRAIAEAAAATLPEVLAAEEKKAEFNSNLRIKEFEKEQEIKSRLQLKPIVKLNEYKAKLESIDTDDDNLKTAIIAADEEKKAKLNEAKALLNPTVKVTLKGEDGWFGAPAKETTVTVEADPDGSYYFLIGNDTTSTSPEALSKLISPEDFNKLMATAQAVVSKTVDAELFKTATTNADKIILDANTKLRVNARERKLLQERIKATEADVVQDEARKQNYITNTLNSEKSKEKEPAIFRVDK